MEVYALVGPSGTGKSHRAAIVANKFGAQAIIDDGLLIQGNRIIAGSSAKRQPTRIGAIKAALFMDNQQAREIKSALAQVAPEKVLILGTSVGMVQRIASRLELPQPAEIMKIEDIASEKEIRKAKFHRTRFSRHVIPAPILEVKKSFPGILVDPLHIFLRKKEIPGKKDWLEQSVIRPTYTFNGKLTIADSAISAIAGQAARLVGGVTSAGRINVNVEQEGVITIDISPTISFGCPLHEVAGKLQRQIKTVVENMTGLQVKEVNIKIKSLSFPKKTTEATS
ncbi:Asp23/Gls24 family envelope stress response protein [Pelotomaculum isophthalicicum JI]|uniref:Asp23/Gls24 family envelope stress response protein n=1 Tax=Pelotomaculum isophthalicicum JI TaxID=947010 RepID=A0A9X4H498_9FIRM|nr:Asp23/Gls24 family envelope stress response protein [Pelotomaculum isophthalicicum]MDF9409646.1 Asp23/Gls24 family envelope stress response protein [Pelotomaculum isophthalicicum JI]